MKSKLNPSMLKTLQKEKLLKILNPAENVFYKILILDQNTKDLLSPLLRLNDLHGIGVTTFFMLHSPRQPVSDIPAVYFVQSSEENVKRIVADVSRQQLYAGYFLNFSTMISRNALESLAGETAEAGLANTVHSVFDQFIEFVALHDNLFTFNTPKAFLSFETAISIEQTALKLFSVFHVLQEAPFIVVPGKKASAGSAIAKKLHSTFSNIKLVSKTSRRPLLVVLDRNFDLVTPVAHKWSYAALLSDLLGLALNKIPANGRNRSFDIADDDLFWRTNHGEPFTVVSERVEAELTRLKKDLAGKCIDDRTDHATMTEILEKAPELSRRNETIKGHMSACLDLVKIIRERSLDEFYRLENTRNVSDDELLEISTKGSDDDIKRLAIILKPRFSTDIIQALLQKRNISQKLLDLPCFTSEEPPALGIRQRMFTSIVGNVKKLLPASSEPPIFAQIETIFNNVRSSRNLSEENLVLDPLNLKTQFYDSEISKIVVFVAGTGNYEEYISLERLQSKIQVPVIYGCDELVGCSEYLDQLCVKHNVE